MKVININMTLNEEFIKTCIAESVSNWFGAVNERVSVELIIRPNDNVLAEVSVDVFTEDEDNFKVLHQTVRP
jgi:hypothetical protein